MSSTESPRGVTGLALWKKKLFTKEDSYHVHKTLGILVLCSYIWRLPKLGREDMGFRSYPEWTLPTLFLHLCLNLSSFEFHIPALRIKSDGGRIWPEYRLHSLIFAGRCIVCMLINWYEDFFDLEPNYELNYIAVMITMVAADLATKSVKHSSHSIQELNAPAGVKIFFSTMQFFATSAALVGHQRMYTLFFYNLFVVQLTPFIMTLRRKNLVSHELNVFLYGLMLAYGFLIGLICVRGDCGIIRLIACVAALWRMGPFPLKNKYVIWTAMHFAMKKLMRPILDDDQTTLFSCYETIDASDVLSWAVLIFGVYTHFTRREKEPEPRPRNS